MRIDGLKSDMTAMTSLGLSGWAWFVELQPIIDILAQTVSIVVGFIYIMSKLYDWFDNVSKDEED